MKIVYKPFALIAAMIGAKIGQSLFKGLWSTLYEEEPPSAMTADASLPKVVLARALEAATMAGVAAIVDRGGARSFAYLTGIWPGEQHAKPA
ncbi:MAG: DUF4235 domain-containing protein [Solirubrobacteraceae bacterium]